MLKCLGLAAMLSLLVASPALAGGREHIPVRVSQQKQAKPFVCIIELPDYFCYTRTLNITSRNVGGC